MTHAQWRTSDGMRLWREINTSTLIHQQSLPSPLSRSDHPHYKPPLCLPPSQQTIIRPNTRESNTCSSEADGTHKKQRIKEQYRVRTLKTSSSLRVDVEGRHSEDCSRFLSRAAIRRRVRQGCCDQPSVTPR